MDTSDKKFLMVFAVVMGILTAIAVFVWAVANTAGNIDYGKSAAKVKMAEERIKPVGQVNLASNPTLGGQVLAVAPAATAEKATPESLYNTACAACHTAGIAGAPKFADKGAWTGRIGKGLETLTNNAINGINGMPARGGSALSDADIKSAVEYMLDAIK